MDDAVIRRPASQADLAPAAVGSPASLQETASTRLACGFSTGTARPLTQSRRCSVEANGLLFYVMPNMEGRSLRERLERWRLTLLFTRTSRLAVRLPHH
jgi:hypothetical protein